MIKKGLNATLVALLLALGPQSSALAAESEGAMAEAKTQEESSSAMTSINHASAEELAAAMNGVGIKKAESIVSYREKYGPFSAVDQLKEVPGIGSALVERNATRLKL